MSTLQKCLPRRGMPESTIDSRALCCTVVCTLIRPASAMWRTLPAPGTMWKWPGNWCVDDITLSLLRFHCWVQTPLAFACVVLGNSEATGQCRDAYQPEFSQHSAATLPSSCHALLLSTIASCSLTGHWDSGWRCTRFSAFKASWYSERNCKGRQTWVPLWTPALTSCVPLG